MTWVSRNRMFKTLAQKKLLRFPQVFRWSGGSHNPQSDLSDPRRFGGPVPGILAGKGRNTPPDPRERRLIARRLDSSGHPGKRGCLPLRCPWVRETAMLSGPPGNCGSVATASLRRYRDLRHGENGLQDVLTRGASLTLRPTSDRRSSSEGEGMGAEWIGGSDVEE